MEWKESTEFKSKWDEFKLGEWRRAKTQKTHITLETVFPEIPKVLLEEPDEKAFYSRQEEIDERVKEIGFTLNEKTNQFKEVLDAKKVNQMTGNEDNSRVFVTSELKSKFAEMSILQNKRKKIYEKQDQASQGQADLIHQRDFLSKKIDSKFNTEDLVPKGIKELEKKLATQVGAQEKKIIRHIQFLRDSIEPIKEVEKLKKIIN